MPDSANSDDARDQSESENTEGTLLGDSDSENESDSGVENRGGGGFFDIEASDSEDDGTSEESGKEEEPDARRAGDDEDPLFPRFMYLPAELRRRVWEFFCPEALGMPRILEFVWDAKYKFEPISEGSSTANVTEPGRVLAAVDRETREIASRAFPDFLRLSDRRGKVRFNPKLDIVMMQHMRIHNVAGGLILAPGFSDKARHLAVNLDMLTDMSTISLGDIFTTFPNLEVIYSYAGRSDMYEDKITWAYTDKVNRYTLRTGDDSAGPDGKEERLFVWPDLANHREFTVEHVRPQVIKPDEILFDTEDVEVDGKSVELWPMIEWTRGEALSESDEELDGESGDEGPSDDALQGYITDEIGMDAADPSTPVAGMTDSEEDLDRYEEDFVVDDGLVEYDDMGTDPLDGESGGEESEGGHPIPDHPGAYTVDQAPFSDLEPGSGEEGSQDGDSSGNESDVREVPARSLPRCVVISDEEEDDGDEEDNVSQAPVRSRARRTVISEDEDEDEDEDDDEGARQALVGRRGRPEVVSEDEDEDEDEGVRQAPVGRRGRRVVVSEDEDEDEDE